MKRQRVAVVAAVAALLTNGLSTHAAERPLWEAGLGVGVLAISSYRGADSSDSYVLPFPYLVYRGRLLRADREGLRGMFVERPGVELNLSLNASTPVRRSTTGPRAGMPALGPAIEMGPSLQWHVWRAPDERLRLDLRLPLRMAFAVGGDGLIGWFFAPNLNLDIAGSGTWEGWNLGLMTGPLFANRRYHEYFYGVRPEFATSARPAYVAPGGYSGAQALVSLSKRYPRYWLGGYLRHDSLTDAAFIDSPLVRRSSSWSAGAGFIWIMGRSSRMVEVDDRE